MAKFCSKCGAQMDDNLMFCGNCGARADAPAPQQAQAPVGYAPQAPAAPAGSIDFMGILTGKADAKTNWIAAIVMQVLSFVLFFLPLYSNGAKGDFKQTAGFFKAHFNGMESGLKTYIIVMMVAVALSVIYMMVPVLKHTKLIPAAALLTAVTQFMFFLSTFICVLKTTSDGGKTTFGFWAWAIISALALIEIIRVVVANKKELI